MARQVQFQVGDLVVLKSGGPVMTVHYVDPDGSCSCTWFAGKKNENAHFQGATLEPAPAEGARP